jgi:hypothetical protein
MPNDLKTFLTGGASSKEDLLEYRKTLENFSEDSILLLPKIYESQIILKSETAPVLLTKTVTISLAPEVWELLDKIVTVHSRREELDISFDDPEGERLSRAATNSITHLTTESGSLYNASLSTLVADSAVDFALKLVEMHMKNELTQAILDKDIPRLAELLETLVKVGLSPTGPNDEPVDLTIDGDDETED